MRQSQNTEGWSSKMAIFGPILDFWGPKWPGLGLKTSKMDSAPQKTPSQTPHTPLNSIWGRNGEKQAFRLQQITRLPQITEFQRGGEGDTPSCYVGDGSYLLHLTYMITTDYTITLFIYLQGYLFSQNIQLTADYQITADYRISNGVGYTIMLYR